MAGQMRAAVRCGPRWGGVGGLGCVGGGRADGCAGGCGGGGWCAGGVGGAVVGCGWVVRIQYRVLIIAYNILGLALGIADRVYVIGGSWVSRIGYRV